MAVSLKEVNNACIQELALNKGRPFIIINADALSSLPRCLKGILSAWH